MTPVVALVLKSGGDFAYEHAIRLWSQLREAGRWKGHVVCLTDMLSGWAPADLEKLPLTRAWRGWWSKLELCAPEQDRLGDILYIDLDTVVVGDVNEIAMVNSLTMLQDFMRPTRLASGVMYLPVAERQSAWELLNCGEGPELVMNSFARRGDQAFFEWCWFHGARRWQDTLPGQIVSYKVHVRPSGQVNPPARLVCYHGKPRPWEAT